MNKPTDREIILPLLMLAIGGAIASVAILVIEPVLTVTLIRMTATTVGTAIIMFAAWIVAGWPTWR
jgi:hypothetical protein